MTLFIPLWVIPVVLFALAISSYTAFLQVRGVWRSQLSFAKDTAYNSGYNEGYDRLQSSFPFALADRGGAWIGMCTESTGYLLQGALNDPSRIPMEPEEDEHVVVLPHALVESVDRQKHENEPVPGKAPRTPLG